MIPFASAVDLFLSKLAGQALEQLEGLPATDLNEWKPKQDLEDINTFFALGTHLVAAGEYWILHAAAGKPIDRNRPAEFRATGDFASLNARYDRWLIDARSALESISETDLTRLFVRGTNPSSGSTGVSWTVADCLMHAVEHTAVHVGHLQIQRQLWNAEHADITAKPQT